MGYMSCTPKEYLLLPEKQAKLYKRFEIILFSKLKYWFEPYLILKRELCCNSAIRKSNLFLMTGPKGKSEFSFPETLNVPQGEAKGNIEVKGKQN